MVQNIVKNTSTQVQISAYYIIKAEYAKLKRLVIPQDIISVERRMKKRLNICIFYAS